MDLSERQTLFLNYLLEQLQFPPSDFRERYLENLSRRCREYVNLAAQPIRRDPKTGGIVYPEDHDFKKYDVQDDRLIPTRFEIIDMLLLELDIKSKGRYTTLSPSMTSISATDISQFTYCPVGWSIAKTFQLPKLLSTQVGSSMHEQYRLLKFVAFRQPDGNVLRPDCDLRSRAAEVNCDSCTKELFSDLAESVAVFVGTPSHVDDRKWYVGSDNRFVAQPDYIFFNPRKRHYFVVEEKFHMIPRPPRTDFSTDWCKTHGYDPRAIERTRQTTKFYDNHLNQLRSYIYGIRDHGVLYGYLVYWRYYFEQNESVDQVSAYKLHIEQVRSRRVSGTNDADRNALRNVYSQIMHAMSNGRGPFSPDRRSPSRCAGCVHSVLCAHKTGRFDAYAFPYDRNCLQTRRVPFPEELRKHAHAEDEDDEHPMLDVGRTD
jgi:CRISPR/Cas system-associated exonuclease Cas4 (RecB family)